MSYESVIQTVLRDKAFYGQQGGVTFSGGEPLSQWIAVRDIADYLHEEGIHVAIDTAGLAPRSVIKDVPYHIDLVLADLKLVTPALHRSWTGVDNAIILNAIRYWNHRCHERFLISIPLIPGVQNELEIEKIADFISNLIPVPSVRFIPYHRLGESKYEALGMPKPQFPGSPDTLVEMSNRIFIEKGIRVMAFED
jgi:pyruvate formate lyase activating enzyme